MTIKNLISDLERNIIVSANTVDTVKAGDAEREVKKAAVAMFASIDTIRAAAAWGADFLIVHEAECRKKLAAAEKEAAGYVERSRKYIAGYIADLRQLHDADLDGGGISSCP